MLQEITRVEVWDHNQNKEWIEKEWDPLDDNEYWKGFKVVNVKQLEKNHTYDIRLISMAEGSDVKVLTREEVTTGESKSCSTFDLVRLAGMDEWDASMLLQTINKDWK